MGISMQQLARVPRGGSLQLLAMDAEALENAHRVVEALRDLGLDPGALLICQGGGGLPLLSMDPAARRHAKVVVGRLEKLGLNAARLAGLRSGGGGVALLTMTLEELEHAEQVRKGRRCLGMSSSCCCCSIQLLLLDAGC